MDYRSRSVHDCFWVWTQTAVRQFVNYGLSERGEWPSVVKVEICSVEDKVNVLCRKPRLKIKEEFLKVHPKLKTERLIKLNQNLNSEFVG